MVNISIFLVSMLMVSSCNADTNDLDIEKMGISELILQLGNVNDDVRDKAEEMLTAQGKKSVEPLVKVLQKSNEVPWRRASAASILAAIGDPKVLPHLIDCLDEKDPEVLTAVILSLGRLGDERAVPPLEKLLASNPDWVIQLSLVEALYELTGAKYKYITRGGEVKFYYPTEGAEQIRQEVVRKRHERLKKNPPPNLGKAFKK